MHRDLPVIQIKLGGGVSESTRLAARQHTLHVNAPFIFLQPKGFQGSFLAQPLSFINKFISTIIACSRIAFGIFVC